MRVGITGHRPDKLGGYGVFVANVRLIDIAVDALGFYGVTECDLGMAQGWDQAVAEACMWHDIPFHAVIPFAGQEERWPLAAQLTYRDTLTKAATVTIMSTNATTAGASFHSQNMEIVRRSELMLTMWDGSFGGTANTLRYAEQLKRPVVNLWGIWSRGTN